MSLQVVVSTMVDLYTPRLYRPTHYVNEHIHSLLNIIYLFFWNYVEMAVVEIIQWKDLGRCK